MVVSDVNINDDLTYSFLAGQSWLSNILGTVALVPTLTDSVGSYSLTMRIEDSNSAADASTLYLDVPFFVEIFETN